MSGPPQRWPLAALAARALLASPPLVSRIAGPPRVRDGRVLDPAVQALLVLGERTGRTASPDDAGVARAEMRRLARLGMPVRRDVQTADRILDGPGGPLPVRTYRPASTPAPPPTMVFAHGGGFVTGDLDTHDAVCRELAAEGRCAVVAVHYRRSPEHPYPAAVEDVHAALAWVHERSDELDVAPGRVGLMGDSAGGNLAAVVALAARGTPHAAVAQCLVYPGVDMTFGCASHRTCGTGLALTAEGMERYRAMYVPDGVALTEPGLSPLHAPDLSGLPPALVVTAGFDPLRDEGLAYVRALRAAGVAARHRCYDDQIHGFFGMGVLPGGMERIREICRQAGDLLAGRTPTAPETPGVTP